MPASRHNVGIVAVVVISFTFADCTANMCQSISSTNAKAYAGWPFHLDCRYLEDEWQMQNKSADEANCSITEGSMEFSPGLYEFNNSETRIFTLTMVDEGDQCMTSLMTVEILPFPNATCQEFLDESKRNGDIIHVEAFNSQPIFRLYGYPPSAQVDVASSAMAGENFETVWIRNCDPDRGATYRPFRSIRNKVNGSDSPDNFLVGNMRFFEAGEYVCSVKYKNDKTLFISTRSVCVKREIIDDPPSAICPLDVRKPAGDTGVIDCEATVPNGPTHPSDLQIEWWKDGTKVCTNSDINENIDTGRYSCSTNGRNQSIACVFDYDDRDDYTKIISLHLDIRGLSAGDFGEYTLKVTHRGRTVQKTSELSEDLAPFYARLAVTLGLLFIVIAVIVAAVVYYQRNTLEVRLRWIKLTGYQKKGRKVYLSYFFDRFAMRDEEMSEINMIVDAISDVTDCYDINRDGMPGSPVAEYVPGEVMRCHTTLLVITSRYIECPERQFDSEQAFGQLLSLKKRIVFVVTPGGYKALKNPNLESSCSNIALAIKVFGAFNWKTSSDAEAKQLREYIKNRTPSPRGGIRYLVGDPEQIDFQNDHAEHYA